MKIINNNLINKIHNKMNNLMKMKIWMKMVSLMNKLKMMICKWRTILMKKIVKVWKKNNFKMYLIKYKMKNNMMETGLKKIKGKNLIKKLKVLVRKQKINSVSLIKGIKEIRIENQINIQKKDDFCYLNIFRFNFASRAKF